MLGEDYVLLSPEMATVVRYYLLIRDIPKHKLEQVGLSKRT